MNRIDRRMYLAAIATTGIAGCLDGQGVGGRLDGDVEGDDATQAVNPTDSKAGSPEPESGLTDPLTGDRVLPLPGNTGDLRDRLVSGGVPQDGIPSIDDPQFLDAEDGDALLQDGEPVFGVERNGVVRAYPQRILVHHEIVNDTIAGENLAITYCPLTGTTQGFERGGTEFGVSGNLINSNLVMYDRETDSYWPQMLAVGIRGPHEGSVLREFPVTWTTWEQWYEHHPETEVLSQETGYARDYTDDPYGSYNPRGGFYASNDFVFPPFAPTIDDVFEYKEVVLGARSADGALAVHKESLAEEKTLGTSVGDVPHVAVYDPRLDTGYVYRNSEDVTVEYDDGRAVVDGETYRPDSLPLDRIVRYDAFWFAWAGYYPETEVLQ